MKELFMQNFYFLLALIVLFGVNVALAIRIRGGSFHISDMTPMLLGIVFLIVVRLLLGVLMRNRGRVDK